MVVSVWEVLLAATITAVFTGFGALPFFFVKRVSQRVMGIANAAAAGLMLGASIGLIVEGVQENAFRLGIGVLLGLLLIVLARRLIGERDDLHIGAVDGADAMKMLLIVGIMTIHSFAEGIGVGVAYGNGESFGWFISAAIAVHNIPEGLAISLVLIPRGVSVWRAAGWSVFSSLPQPIMAVPAFLFVLAFAPFLAVGLGLAAGAMIWMVFSELLPDATHEVSRTTAYSTMAVSVLAMLAFQALIG